MLLTTLVLLTSLAIAFSLPLFFPSIPGYRFLTIFGGILFLIMGATILMDGKGLERENGIVRTNETGTGQDAEFVEETVSIEINEELSYTFGLGYLFIGLAIILFSAIPRERDEVHPIDNQVSDFDDPIGPIDKEG